MFEQCILTEHPGNKGWSLLASLTGQLLLLATLLALPLIFTQQLLPVQWASNYLVAPLPPPPPVHIQSGATHSVSPARPAFERIFTAPTRIPDRIATHVTEDFAAPTAALDGVPGGTGTGPALSFLHTMDPPPQTIARPEPPPARAQVPGKPISVSSGVQSAKLIRRVIPVYPEIAKRARISGTVRLVGIIGKDGTIQNLQLVSGPPLLVPAALEAVKQWIYRPTLLSGEPVEVIAPIDVIFTLNQ